MLRTKWNRRLSGILAVTLAASGGWAFGQIVPSTTSDPVVDADAYADEIYSDDLEVRSQGVIHEAFATPVTNNPPEAVVVAQAPPEPVEEVPPEYQPEGRNVVWIPGYWHFDVALNDFVWISGLWRDVPPNQTWVPGYWDEIDGGYQWVPGIWMSESTAAAAPEYLPEPPESLEQGPTAEAPSEEYFWIPGNWQYQNRDYVWRPGYWSPHHVGWVWVPSRYIPTTYGYRYCDGYWDYHYRYRGQLYAPIYYRSPIYRQAGYRYVPRVVVDTTRFLLVHLWVYPRYGNYYYGNYYGSPYANIGYVPWYSYNSRYFHRDPFYDYMRWRYGTTYLTSIQRWHRFYDNNPYYRPRPTLYQQINFVNSVTNYSNINISDSIIRHSVLAAPITQIVQNQGLGRYWDRRDTDFVRISDRDREQYRARTAEYRQRRDQRAQRERELRRQLADRGEARRPRYERADEVARRVRDEIGRREQEEGRDFAERRPREGRERPGGNGRPGDGDRVERLPRERPGDVNIPAPVDAPDRDIEQLPAERDRPERRERGARGSDARDRDRQGPRADRPREAGRREGPQRERPAQTERLPRADRPGAEQPRAERPRVEGPRADRPRVETERPRERGELGREERRGGPERGPRRGAEGLVPGMDDFPGRGRGGRNIPGAVGEDQPRDAGARATENRRLRDFGVSPQAADAIQRQRQIDRFRQQLGTESRQREQREQLNRRNTGPGGVSPLDRVVPVPQRGSDRARDLQRGRDFPTREFRARPSLEQPRSTRPPTRQPTPRLDRSEQTRMRTAPQVQALRELQNRQRSVERNLQRGVERSFDRGQRPASRSFDRGDRGSRPTFDRGDRGSRPSFDRGDRGRGNRGGGDRGRGR